MDARDLQQIDAFLTDVGQASLLEYYGVEPDTPADQITTRVRSRRAWAQAQQSNPKYRFQALWLIKNNALVQRVMLKELRAYVEAVAARERDRKLQMLDLFVQGSLVSGRITNEAEAAIRRQAHEMGLSESETSRYLETKVGIGESDQESLFEPTGQQSSADPEDDFVDHYELLQISPQATSEEIEEAYRERYRWARTLKDLQRANDIYQQLEQAWRLLSDTGRRRDYDDQRKARLVRLAAAKPVAPIEVPHALRASPQSSLPPDDSDLSIEDDETAERPSEIRLGRPPWASDSQDHQASTSPPSPSPLLEEASLPQPPTPRAVRTFQPGTPEAPARPHHTPKLRVEGPDQMVLSLGLRNHVRTIKVINAGRGRLRGNVASSQSWLQVSPRTLHIKDEPQLIELTAIPRRLTGQSGRARVTISTTHGERWAITIDAHRRRSGAWVAASLCLATLVFLVGVKLGFIPVHIRGISPPPKHEVRTLLQIAVEPPTAHIFLDDRPAGSGPAQIYEDPVLPGEPLELKVSAPNTQPYVEELVFVDSQRIRRNVRLVVGPDPPSWAEDPETGRHLLTALAPRLVPPPRVEEPSPDPEEQPPPEGAELPSLPGTAPAPQPTGQQP